jgi:plastocyanin
LSVAKRLGVARLLVAGRALSDPVRSGHEQLAFGGGATIRLGTYVALAADVASLTNRDSSERIAWSAGLHLAIPLSPHTLSLQATNTTVGTLQGASRGTKTIRYGFEFTIPITLRRYFGNHEPPPPPVVATQPGIDTAVVRERRLDSLRADTVARPIPPVTDTVTRAAPTPEKPVAQPPNESTPSRVASRPVARVVRTGMRNITYLQKRIEITVGSTVEWKNNDPLAHTVTAADKSFDSGNIMPGQTWRHTFTKPGTYSFYCTPHPFMKGVIVVRGS